MLSLVSSELTDRICIKKLKSTGTDQRNRSGLKGSHSKGLYLRGRRGDFLSCGSPFSFRAPPYSLIGNLETNWDGGHENLLRFCQSSKGAEQSS